MSAISKISPDGGITEYDLKDALTRGYTGTRAEVIAAINNDLIAEDMLVYITDDDSSDTSDIDLSGADTHNVMLVQIAEM